MLFINKPVVQICAIMGIMKRAQQSSEVKI